LDKDASSGRPFDELGIFSEPKSLLASLEGVSPESEVRNLEILMTPIGARPRACLLSCASLRQDGVDCWLLLLNDIADRKLAELELRKSRDILLNVMNSIPLAVFWKSPEGRFLGCNDVFAKLAGFDRPNQIIGLSDFELPWRKEESDAYVKDDKAVIERGEGFSHKLETLTRADGSRIWVDTSKMPLLDENGRAYAILGVFEDISERVFAEKEKAKLHAQLDQARKMESVGRLAGGVAHDFNNMLQAITGYVFVLKKRLAADSSALAPLEEIEKAAKRSSALTSQLLAFARRQTVAPKLISINSAIDGMLNMLRRLVGESVSLEWKPGDALKCVKMDPSQLDQVVANLVVNARDAIEGDGRIVMETASFRLEEGADGRHPDCKPGEYVLLKVSDTGKGMSKEVLEHLFEPFFTTKATGKGTGLGLATVFGVVKQNGGSIEVFSEPGKGSVFEILFPALDGAPEDEAKNRPPAPAKGDETILVVEDGSRSSPFARRPFPPAATRSFPRPSRSRRSPWPRSTTAR
jgi:PAS domain S-box-containing protein